VLTALLSAAPSTQAVQEKERGDRLAANNDLAGAADAYDNAEKLSPGYAEAINQHGFLFARQGKLEESLAYFKRAIEADSSFPLARYNLGFVLRKLGRHAEATEALKAYVALAPDDASGQYSLADSYGVVGDKANALKAYERYVAIEKDPGKQARLDKANKAIEQLRRELGVKEAAASAPPAGSGAASTGAVAVPAAAAVATTTVTVTPAVAPAAAASSSAAVPAPAAAPATAAPQATAAQGTTTPAASAEQASAVPPERAALAQQKMEEARTMRAAGKKRETLFALQDAVNADPNNARAVFELGVAYAESFYYPQAVERWQRVLTMNVDEATRAAARENIEKAQKLMGGASATAPQAAGSAASEPAAAAPAAATASSAGSGTAASSQAISPAAQDAYLKGAELYGQQRYAEAIQQFGAAIAANADFPQAFTARGSAYFATQELGKALADYSQAMRIDSTLASPVFGVAETLSAMGRKADAIPYYQAYAASHASDVDPQLQEVARKRLAEIGQ
jgi:tetratricopeptide (TPR) repeat protein